MCTVGEVSVTADLCEPCGAFAFSFEPRNSKCQACPSGGVCAGRFNLVPDDGFFQSSPSSDRMLACPNADACTWPGRLDALQAFQRSLEANYSKFLDDVLVFASSNTSTTTRRLLQQSSVAPYLSAYSNNTAYVDLQCSSGYRGPLCGACEEGYGWMPPFRCEECRSLGVQALLYILSLLVSVVMIGLTMWGSLKDAKRFKSIILEEEDEEEEERQGREASAQGRGSSSKPKSGSTRSTTFENTPGVLLQQARASSSSVQDSAASKLAITRSPNNSLASLFRKSSRSTVAPSPLSVQGQRGPVAEGLEEAQHVRSEQAPSKELPAVPPSEGQVPDERASSSSSARALAPKLADGQHTEPKAGEREGLEGARWSRSAKSSTTFDDAEAAEIMKTLQEGAVEASQPPQVEARGRGSQAVALAASKDAEDSPLAKPSGPASNRDGKEDRPKDEIPEEGGEGGKARRASSSGSTASQEDEELHMALLSFGPDHSTIIKVLIGYIQGETKPPLCMLPHLLCM